MLIFENMEKMVKNLKETEKIAQDLFKKIKPNKKGAVAVALYGDLGAGKTTFTKFFIKNLGILKKVKSPTFVIMKKYSFPKNFIFKNFYHLDAYRLNASENLAKELDFLKWHEILNKPENLIFIEWPENIQSALPKKHYQIQISHLEPSKNISSQHRKFKIKKM